ncbi:MAG: ABC transporter ATP-binding protein [Lachnospiraceae bacterium]|nr:ABC transporter ATP-binding protein [Lachnospiraceae bacterium]
MINLINVVKNYGTDEACTHALRGVNLTIEEGSFTALMGPSGSGKSTLLNIIGGMDRLTSGQYIFRGQDISALSNPEIERFRKENVAFIFQNYALMNQYSVYENVEMPLIARKIRNRKEVIMNCLREVGIQELADKPVNRISGGERQRAAIARAIATNAPLLLADEPTGSLDRSAGAEILELFEQLHRSGKTILMITHDEEIAARAERIVRIRNGVIVD